MSPTTPRCGPRSPPRRCSSAGSTSLVNNAGHRRAGHGRGQRRRRVAPRARRQRGRHRPGDPGRAAVPAAVVRAPRSSTRARSPPPPGCRTARCTARARAPCWRSRMAMAADHVREGIRVNCVNPGTADTPWVGRLLDAADRPGGRARRARGPPADGPTGHGRRGRARDRLPGQPAGRLHHRYGARRRRRHAEPAAPGGSVDEALRDGSRIGLGGAPLAGLCCRGRRGRRGRAPSTPPGTRAGGTSTPRRTTDSGSPRSGSAPGWRASRGRSTCCRRRSAGSSTKADARSTGQRGVRGRHEAPAALGLQPGRRTAQHRGLAAPDRYRSARHRLRARPGRPLRRGRRDRLPDADRAPRPGGDRRDRLRHEPDRDADPVRPRGRHRRDHAGRALHADRSGRSGRRAAGLRGERRPGDRRRRLQLGAALAAPSGGGRHVQLRAGRCSR